MGQAKLRGTYQERRTLAIEKAGIEREEAKRLKIAKALAMTEEERERKRDAERVFANMLSICLAQGILPYRIKE